MIANLFNEWEATPHTWIFLLWSFVFFLGTEDSSKAPYYLSETVYTYLEDSSWRSPPQNSYHYINKQNTLPETAKAPWK